MAESLAIFQTEFKRISRVIKDFVDADLAKEETAALNAALAAKHYRDFYQEAIVAQLKSSFDFAAAKKSAVVSNNETGCLASASKSETLAAGFCRKMGLIKTEGKAIEKLIADIDKDLKDRSKSSKSKPQIENIKKDLAAIKQKYSAQKNKLGGMAGLSGLMTQEKKILPLLMPAFKRISSRRATMRWPIFERAKWLRASSINTMACLKGTPPMQCRHCLNFKTKKRRAATDSIPNLTRPTKML